MNFHRGGAKFLLFAMLLCAASGRLHATPQHESNLTPQEIENLIASNAALPHGAQFENQGPGVATFLFKKSADRHIFLFTRGGKSIGEYRDEILDGGKILRIDEMYLANDARKNTAIGLEKELPFVRKTTVLKWVDAKWVGSDIRWESVLRRQNGEISKRLRHGKDHTSVATMEIIVPATLRTEGKEYYVEVYQKKPSEFDQAFSRQVVDGKGKSLRLGTAVDGNEVIDGKSKIRVEWSARHPELLIELQERIPSPYPSPSCLPHCALSSSAFEVITKAVASMQLDAASLLGGKVVFESNRDLR